MPLPGEDAGAPVPMSSKRLEKMRTNPRNDWTIEDIVKVCRDLGMNCHRPSSGSHYTVSSGFLVGALTVPYKRPIKPVYIRQLVSLADAHVRASSGGAGE
ncbi:HicA-related toxin-antitoxin protein [Salinarimonas ramus]|uniref:HicA-related toxin-antitoxin protein n=1 Tax=Salinarimonas ramus TaxID=690164 RepID=A0A917Q3L8_9HYPH|nr:HicA-related toxin-antitoxin protein [Salinarimonas ramus]